MAALVGAFIAKDADDVPAIEGEREAIWLDINQLDFLPQQLVQVDRRKSIFIRVVAMQGAGLANVLKIALDADTCFVEDEMNLPSPEADLFKLSTDEELDLFCVWERMHAAVSSLWAAQAMSALHPKIL